MNFSISLIRNPQLYLLGSHHIPCGNRLLSLFIVADLVECALLHDRDVLFGLGDVYGRQQICRSQRHDDNVPNSNVSLLLDIMLL